MLVRLSVSTVALVLGAAGALAQPLSACPAERAVYVADGKPKQGQADELRFTYGDDTPFGMPRARFTFMDRGFSIELDPYMTNSSGVVGVTGEIPYDRLSHDMKENARVAHERRTRGRTVKPGTSIPGFEIGSIVVTVDRSLAVGSLPRKGTPAPELAIFPEFQRLGHITTIEAAGIGLVVSSFRLARCE